MLHAERNYEEVLFYSMGKKFKVRAICTSDDEANQFMERNPETALIACFGPFNIIANKYEGVSQ